jgi:hypothetical protein
MKDRVAGDLYAHADQVAGIVAMMDGDCGTCVQKVANLGKAEGVDGRANAQRSD